MDFDSSNRIIVICEKNAEKKCRLALKDANSGSQEQQGLSISRVSSVEKCLS